MAVARIGFALFGALVAALAVVFALTEYRAFLQWSLPTVDFVASAGDGPLDMPPARSIRTEDEQMSACLYGIQWVQYFPESAGQTDAIVTGCDARARDILGRSPTRSIAHLVVAFAADRAGRPDAAITALRHSAETGSQKGWLAAERLGFALSLARQRPAEGAHRGAILDAVAQDVLTLAGEASLAGYAAGQFVRFPEFQDWMIALIEAQPPQVQRRFLARVKTAQQAMAGS